jgi:hypothetical protein
MRVKAVREFAQKATQRMRAPPPEKDNRNAPPTASEVIAPRIALSHPGGRSVSVCRKRRIPSEDVEAASRMRWPLGAGDR